MQAQQPKRIRCIVVTRRYWTRLIISKLTACRTVVPLVLCMQANGTRGLRRDRA